MFTSRYFVQDEKRSRKQAFRWKKEPIETTQDDTIIFLRAKASLAGLVAVVTAWARMRKQFISLVDGEAHYSSLFFLKCMGETHQTLSPPTVSSQSYCYKELENSKPRIEPGPFICEPRSITLNSTSKFTINLSHTVEPSSTNGHLSTLRPLFFVPADIPYIDSF